MSLCQQADDNLSSVGCQYYAIDVTNPGKSAALWALKGYYDTDYNGDGIAEDDEGHGGGSAISQTKVSNPSL